MKTLALFYSYTGHTKSLAQKLFEETDTDIFEIKDEVRPSAFKAYTAGCFAAMRKKRSPIETIEPDLNKYDKIIVMAPVWAGFPAPAINNVFDILPKKKDVEVYLISASGNSSCGDVVQGYVENRGCTLTKFENIKN